MFKLLNGEVSVTRLLSCNAVSEILLCRGKDLTLIGKHRVHVQFAVLTRPQDQSPTLRTYRQDTIKLGRTRGDLSFRIRFLPLAFAHS